MINAIATVKYNVIERNKLKKIQPDNKGGIIIHISPVTKLFCTHEVYKSEKSSAVFVICSSITVIVLACIILALLHGVT